MAAAILNILQTEVYNPFPDCTLQPLRIIPVLIWQCWPVMASRN